MFIAKRSNGIYYIFYDGTNGKRTCISTRTKLKSEAVKFLTNFNIELIRREKQKVIMIRLLDFRNCFRSYSIINHSYKTGKDYQSVFNKFIEFTGNIYLTDISEKLIYEYIQERSKISMHTISKDLRYLRCAFSWAVNQNYLLKNPCSSIKPIKPVERLPLYFSEDEFQILLEVIDNKDIKDIVIFGANTGLRLMEILTARWKQVNFQQRYIILDNQNHITKSKKIRSVVLNQRVIQILTERRVNSSSDHIFTMNNEFIKPDKLSKIFKKYVIKAKINPMLKFHSLRHTFASWLVQRGVSIYEVSKLLGHSDVRVTQIYAHLQINNLRSAVELLN